MTNSDKPTSGTSQYLKSKNENCYWILVRAILGLFICSVGSISPGFGQYNDDLFKAIMKKDSLLFNVGFNECNLAPFYELVDDHCEFYHDQNGYTTSKAQFIEQIENGLCKLDYKASREIVPGSIQVFPLKSSGELYGAIQEGEHRFFAKYPDKEAKITSEARFVHLWIKEEDRWRLKRVLSYDHQSPK